MESIYNIVAFNTKIDQTEVIKRTQAAARVILLLTNLPEWRDRISGAYLFGSLINGEPRKESDVDVAIISEETTFEGLGLDWMQLMLKPAIHKAKEQLQIGSLRINPTVVARPWLNNPELSDFIDPDVIRVIKREGVVIFDNS